MFKNQMVTGNRVLGEDEPWDIGPDFLPSSSKSSPADDVIHF